MLSKASEIPRAVALVVATGYQGAATGAIGSCWLSYSGCPGHYQNILDRRSTWIMANRHFGKIAQSGSMPRWPRCWSESLQAGYAETAFESLGIPEVTAVGRELDHKVADLLALLGVAASSVLTG